MISNDNQQYITVELFNSKMEAFIAQIRLDNEQLRNELNAKINDVQSSFNTKIDGVQSNLRSEMHTGFSALQTQIQAVDANVQVNAAKIEMLQHTFYWGFAILAFIAAFVPFLRRERKEEKPITDDNVREIVHETMAGTIQEAVAKAVAQAVKNLDSVKGGIF